MRSVKAICKVHAHRLGWRTDRDSTVVTPYFQELYLDLIIGETKAVIDVATEFAKDYCESKGLVFERVTDVRTV